MSTDQTGDTTMNQPTYTTAGHTPPAATVWDVAPDPQGPGAPTITVIGTGYLGATHAVCMAALGFRVIGVDVDPSRSSGSPPGSCPSSSPASPSCCPRRWRPGG